MRRLFITLVAVIFLSVASAQNMGIGTTAPTYPLTVAANNNGIGIVQKNGTVEMGFVTNASTGGWLKTLSNHNLNFTVNHIASNPDPVMILSTTGNVGISTGSTAPAYRLDINGRMRIRDVTQTAGIWFDGPTLPTRSFIGTINEGHVGIWGGGGAGWNIAMNVENGNTGIGTPAPSARLDINGGFRLRSNSPKIGSVLMSTDANGNATWQAPVAFRAWGSPDGNSTVHNYPNGQPGLARYYFSSATDYNLGFHYNGNTSEFTAPVNGIYHFNAQMAFEYENRFSTIAISVYNSSGTFSHYKYCQTDNGKPYPEWDFGIFEDVITENVARIAVDLRLDAGDKVRVYYSRTNYYGDPVYDSISPDPKVTWFAGHLITRL